MKDDIVSRAAAFAAKAHSGAKRKGNGMPYILHPMEDAVIVSTITDDPEIIAAALLHDTVEDTDVTAEDIEREFGARVASLVAHETENKRREMRPEDSWKIRKEESLEVLKNGPRETKILWLGDKLSNIRAIARSYDEIGFKFFELFHQKDPEQQGWYYKTVLEYLSDFDGCPAYEEYKTLVRHVFGE